MIQKMVIWNIMKLFLNSIWSQMEVPFLIIIFQQVQEKEYVFLFLIKVQIL